MRSKTTLRGRTIFLSASVPTPDRGFERIEDAAFEIEQAVISLARSIFSAGGTLVFGGHPSISPLVAMVAGEYQPAFLAESGEGERAPLTTIYQSEAFRERAVEANFLIFKLQSAKVVWTPVRRDSGETQSIDGSLFDMRTAMVEQTAPAAMVCIGGMDGVHEEVEIYRKYFPRRPVFVLGRTGGASGILALQKGTSFDVIDLRIEADLQRRRQDHRGESDIQAEEKRKVRGDERFKTPAVPYPLIMQNIVQQVAKSDF